MLAVIGGVDEAPDSALVCDTIAPLIAILVDAVNRN